MDTRYDREKVESLRRRLARLDAQRRRTRMLLRLAELELRDLERLKISSGGRSE